MARTKLQEERSKKTRKRRRKEIVKSSIKVFSEMGLDGASIRAIAKGSGISLALLYKYFENKDEIIRECTVTFHERIQKHITRIVVREINDPDALSNRTVNYIDRVIDICRFLLQVMAHPIYSKMMDDTNILTQNQIEEAANAISDAYGTDPNIALSASILLNSTINDYILKKSRENYFRQMDGVKILFMGTKA